MIHNMNLTICTCFTQLLVRDECLLFIKTHILHKFGWEFIERERIFFSVHSSSRLRVGIGEGKIEKLVRKKSSFLPNKFGAIPIGGMKLVHHQRNRYRGKKEVRASDKPSSDAWPCHVDSGQVRTHRQLTGAPTTTRSRRQLSQSDGVVRRPGGRTCACVVFVCVVT